MGIAQTAAALDLKQTIAADEAKLEQEEAALKSVDKVLKSEQAKELLETTQISKAEDAVIAAMKKGDKAQVAKLEAEVRRLKDLADDDEKKVVALQSELAKEVEVEKKTKAALSSELKAEDAIEDKDALVAEEEELKKTVGPDISSIVSRFFKQ